MKKIGLLGDTRNFQKLLDIHKKNKEPIHLIQASSPKSLTQQIFGFDIIILILPIQTLTTDYHPLLLNYAKQGGMLIILSRQGGDLFNNTHHSALVEAISDRNDLLVNPSLIKFYQPTLKLEWSYQKSSFYGKVIYDGGCSYDLSEDFLNNQKGFAIQPKEALSVVGLHRTNGSQQLNGRQFQRAKYYWEKEQMAGSVLVHIPIEAGSITYWGARWAFSDSNLLKAQNLRCWYGILDLYTEKDWKTRLRQKMKRPQRHRLLHAYPMTSGLDPYDGHPRQLMHTHRKKRNAIGIIPHTFCNTGLKGCGFCTFPHEKYSKTGIKESMQAVIKELQIRKQTSSSFVTAPLSSIYIGGGTANLSQREEWKQLLEELTELSISPQTEITLEGAPLYFWSNRGLLEDICTILPNIKKRISIGVQTFNDSYLSLMGRTLMNKKLTEAIELARKLGFHISIDLLCNLPGQTTSEILDDIQQAVNLGVPHICVYNLVCYDGLNTEWAKNPKMIDALPSSKESIKNMSLVFNELQRLGYDAITLTDFQKRGSDEAGRYRYEEDIREPEHVNWWGIGPGGISVLWDRIYAVKLENPRLSSEYIEKINSIDIQTGASWAKSCIYASIERKLYWLTRQIKGLSINPEQYQLIFKSKLEDDFGNILALFIEENLLTENYRLTQDGCFFADSIAGLLVEYALFLDMNNQLPITKNSFASQSFEKQKKQLSEKTRSLRYHSNDARRFHMG